MMKSVRVAGILTLATAAALSAAAGETTRTVSPGDPGRPSVVEGRCPTFSWSAVPGAEDYEIVVYEFSEERLSAAPEPTLARVLPGGALSWTPGRDDCLAVGTSYAWFVRAVGPGLEGAWSKERLFTTESRVRTEDATEALVVLQRYLSDGGELANLVEGAPAAVEAPVAIEAPMAVPIAGESSSVALSLVVGQEEADGKVNAVAPAAPSPLAPLPLAELGIRSFVSGATDDQNRAATRGAWASGEYEQAIGYLGVDLGSTEAGDFDGLSELRLLGKSEIGVLGVGSGNAQDAHGVAGVSRGGFGGVFYQTDIETTSNLVLLATNYAAMDANGPVFAQSLTATGCLAGTHEVGAWCIGPEQSANTYVGALENCWSKDMQLCSLQAILACDVRQPPGADCTATTDSVPTEWIWCAELEDATNDDVEAFWTGDPPKPGVDTPRARVFANNGNHAINEIDFADKYDTYVSFCCTARP